MGGEAAQGCDSHADSQGSQETGNWGLTEGHHPTVHFASKHTVRSRAGLSPSLTDSETEAGFETSKTIHSPEVKSAPPDPRFSNLKKKKFYYFLCKIAKMNPKPARVRPLPHSVLAPNWEVGGGALHLGQRGAGGQNGEVAQGLGQCLQSWAVLHPEPVVGARPFPLDCTLRALGEECQPAGFLSTEGILGLC